MPASMVKKLKEQEKEEEELGLENHPFDKELEEQEKETAAEITLAMTELYGNSIKQTKPEEKKEEVMQGAIPFEAAIEDDLPTLDISDLDDEENLLKVEQIPAWKRRFMKK
jgi:hypothetical protein